MAPSVSYSIIVRLEVASRGRAVSEITRVVGYTGGVVTALDVDAQSRHISDGMLIAAAQALADVVSPDEIGPHYIVPSVFHPDVTSSVAAAVKDAATSDVGTTELDR